MQYNHLLNDVAGDAAAVVVLGALGLAFGKVLDGGVALNAKAVGDSAVGGGIEGSNLDVTVYDRVQ